MDKVRRETKLFSGTGPPLPLSLYREIMREFKGSPGIELEGYNINNLC